MFEYSFSVIYARTEKNLSGAVRNEYNGWASLGFQLKALMSVMTLQP